MPDHALLTADDHRDLRVRTDRAAALGDAVMACLTFPHEFRRVQDEYAILFRQTPERDGYHAMAIFGFENGENLFLRDGRGWDADYIPLAMAIQPFLIGSAVADAVDKQVHVDRASPRIAAAGSDDGVRLFDADGRPSPYLEDIAEKLGALDEGYRAAPAFFAALERHRLLEPLTLEVTLADGSTNRLLGFHVIDEERLRELDGSALADLHADDHLVPLFMAIASLGRLSALIARKNAAARGG